MVVLGPTASGKTRLSVALAEQLHTGIVSYDSRQFFEEMRIGVARPTDEELSRVPHHFIACRSVHDGFSAGMYAEAARPVLHRLLQQHGAAVVTGGSGLYLDALLYGFDPLPGDEAIRNHWTHRLEQEGIAALREALRAADPVYFQRVDLHNPHRIIRALEVTEITGIPYSTQLTGQKPALPFRLVKIGLTGSRDTLYERINARVHQMMKEGLQEEARTLYSLRGLSALRTVGYAELFSFFEGMCTQEEAVSLICQHTRQYARRQLTWWRKDPEIQWLDIENTNLASEALQLVRNAQQA